MSLGVQRIEEYLLKLGISTEIASIYVALHTHGAQSVSGLARIAGIERTRIYRLMDELTRSHLIEVETHYKRNVFRAAPLANLQILIAKKEQEVHDLEKDLIQLHADMEAGSSISQSGFTKVQFFQGPEGLKQMHWNQTRGKTENLSILHENMQRRTHGAFFERWARTCNKRHLKFRSVINDNFIATQEEWYRSNTNDRLARWEGRRISNTVFPITHSTVIYDDVTAYYNWEEDQLFGVEIHNQQVANTGRQFFEILWHQSASVKEHRDDNM